MRLVLAQVDDNVREARRAAAHRVRVVIAVALLVAGAGMVVLALMAS